MFSLLEEKYQKIRTLSVAYFNIIKDVKFENV